MSRHLYWLFVNLLLVLVVSFALVGWVWVTSADREREGRIQNCIAINELSRRIYVTMLDLGYSTTEAQKFLPTQHCEDVP